MEHKQFYHNSLLQFEHCESSLNETTDALSHNGRSKRDLFSGLLAGISLGIGLYDTYEISKLKQTENNLIHEVGLTAMKVNQNTRNLKKLATMGRTLYSNQNKTSFALTALSFRQGVEQNVLKFCMSVNEFSRAISDLMHGAISLQLFSENTLRDFFKTAGDIAFQNGYNLVYKHFMEILTSNISFFVEGREVKIFIHIPLSSFQSMDILRLDPSPLQLSNETFAIVKESNLLAVKDSQFFEFTDLNECRKMSHSYLCHGNVLKRKKNSCIFSLYTNLENYVACDLTYLKKETIWQLNDNEFVGFFLPDTRIIINNGTKFKSASTISGIWRFELKHRTSLETKDHLVEPSFSVKVKAKQISFKSFTQVLYSAPELENVLQYLPDQNQDLIDVQKWQKFAQSSSSQQMMLWVMLGVLGIFSILTTFTSVMYCYYERVRVKTKRKLSPSPLPITVSPLQREPEEEKGEVSEANQEGDNSH